jgi:GWxTD domain-containing protein
MRKLHYWEMIFLFLLIGFFFWSSESGFSSSEHPLSAQLDVASFAYQLDSTLSYVEIYYSLDRRKLDFVKQKEGFAAVMILNLKVEESSGNLVTQKEWKVGSLVKSLAEGKETDYTILDMAIAPLKPGEYNFSLRAEDVNSGVVDSVQKKVKIGDYRGNSLKIADLELAFKISPDSSENVFLKGGQKVLPNPSLIFNLENNILYFYSEIYNLAFSSGKEKDYLLNYSILDSMGNSLRDFGTKENEKPGNSAVILSGLNVSTLPTGKYFLKISVADLENNQKAESQKEFYFLHPLPVFEKSVSQELQTEEDAKRIRNEISYIAIKSELSMYEHLNLEGKRKFLGEFWKSKDPNPDTPENEFKIEHYRRWNYAIQNFSRTSKDKDGWRTDMGRIYVIYGKPDDRDLNPSSVNTVPWERWDYPNIEGGLYFIFADTEGFGVYRLIDSNAKGEIKNPNWQNIIQSSDMFR